MTHWLELFLTSTTAFFSGGLSMWYIQRGQCRSCRIRYGVRRLLLPFAKRLTAKMPVESRPLMSSILNVTAIALAFAPVDSCKIGWNIAKVSYQNRKRGNSNGRKEKAPVS
jgi:hypothetical protein